MTFDLTNIRREVDGLKAEYSHARRKVREEKAALRAAEDKLADSLAAQKLLQAVAQTVQRRAHQRISSVVSKCLAAVFPECGYEFKVLFVQSRGKTEARCVFEKEGHEVSPTAAGGGGVLDVAAVALRLAALVLSRPKARRLLVLDEPMKHVSRDKGMVVGEVLRTLAKEMSVQIIIVTHNQDLEVGKVVRMSKQKKVCKACGGTGKNSKGGTCHPCANQRVSV